MCDQGVQVVQGDQGDQGNQGGQGDQDDQPDQTCYGAPFPFSLKLSLLLTAAECC